MLQFFSSQLSVTGRLKQLPTSCGATSGTQRHAAFSHWVHMVRVRQPPGRLAIAAGHSPAPRCGESPPVARRRSCRAGRHWWLPARRLHGRLWRLLAQEARHVGPRRLLWGTRACDLSRHPRSRRRQRSWRQQVRPTARAASHRSGCPSGCGRRPRQLMQVTC